MRRARQVGGGTSLALIMTMFTTASRHGVGKLACNGKAALAARRFVRARWQGPPLAGLCFYFVAERNAYRLPSGLGLRTLPPNLNLLATVIFFCICLHSSPWRVLILLLFLLFPSPPCNQRANSNPITFNSIRINSNRIKLDQIKAISPEDKRILNYDALKSDIVDDAI